MSDIPKVIFYRVGEKLYSTSVRLASEIPESDRQALVGMGFSINQAKVVTISGPDAFGDVQESDIPAVELVTPEDVAKRSAEAERWQGMLERVNKISSPDKLG